MARELEGRPLTERETIDTLRALVRRWPSQFWLLAKGGELWVMRYDDTGCRVIRSNGSIDLSYTVAIISIPSFDATNEVEVEVDR